MQEFFTFLRAEWMLSITFIVLFIMLLWGVVAPLVHKFSELKPVDIVKLINSDNALVVDVSSENEFINGHIVNSINIPASYLSKRLDKLGNDKERPLIVVCKSGGRAKSASALLCKEGFKNVTVLAGGLMAWQHGKYPLAKGKK
ncbi:MAG: rhodanese-like domain-containing protein [Gammaproteobacteria bacterium]|nr:rhodanese-like domain-containing protein [Gammaproteobacteria bacterium]MCF6230997.1 rhodanese-like domain-containing protein [Gammaproteobacteria bacterium]